MEPTMHGFECESFDDDLAALAVGSLTGHDRARMLAHLESCSRCTARLEELSATTDALTALLPEAIPPEGFADRTVARFRAEQTPARRPLSRRLVAAAAVVATLALGAGVGEVVAASQGAAPVTAFRTAPLHSKQGAEGTVVLTSTGERGWLVMTLHDVPEGGTVTCSIVLSDGTRQVVGRFSLADGYGSWVTVLPVSATSVRTVRVVDGSGSIVATGRLT